MLAKEPEFAESTEPLLAKTEKEPVAAKPKTPAQKKKATKAAEPVEKEPVVVTKEAEPAAKQPASKKNKKANKKAKEAPVKAKPPTPVESSEDDSDDSSNSDVQIVEKPKQKGKKQVAKTTPNVVNKSATEPVRAKPVAEKQQPATLYQVSAALTKGSIGVEIDMDWEETQPKARKA